MDEKPFYDHMIRSRRVDEAYKHCKSTIRSIQGDKIYYIGATNDPERRLDEHISDKGLWNMYVLCELPTKAKSVEKHLIKVFGKYNDNYSMVIDNKPPERRR